VTETILRNSGSFSARATRSSHVPKRDTGFGGGDQCLFVARSRQLVADLQHRGLKTGPVDIRLKISSHLFSDPSRLLCGIATVFGQPNPNDRRIIYRPEHFQRFLDLEIGIPLRIEHGPLVTNRSCIRYVAQRSLKSSGGTSLEPVGIGWGRQPTAPADVMVYR
jgi:hypothetical protein